MRVAKFIHSCLLVENGTDRVLIDPGTFTFAGSTVPLETFDRIAAIVITHRHADHVDQAAVKRILERNRSAIVLASADVRELLAAAARRWRSSRRARGASATRRFARSARNTPRC
jgi:L-ascorbate metabolism protein UlaG (beta-lactamase superfamily)